MRHSCIAKQQEVILVVNWRLIIAKGLFEPLKVLRTLIVFGTKELEKFGFSIFTFQF